MSFTFWILEFGSPHFGPALRDWIWDCGMDLGMGNPGFDFLEIAEKAIQDKEIYRGVIS